MGFLRGVWLILASVILIISITLLGIHYSTSRVLDLDYYDGVLNDSGAYEAISTIRDNFEASFIKIPSSENTSRIEGVRLLALRLIGNTLSYLKDETDVLDLKVDVDVESINSFFLSRVESLPYCSDNPMINGAGKYDLDGNIICRDINESSEEILNSYLETQNLSSILNQGSYDLGETFNKDGNMAKIKSYVNYYLILKYVLIALISILILLTLIFSIHKESSAFRWIGASMIISSAILLYSRDFLNQQLPKIDFGDQLSSFLPDSLNLVNMLFDPLLNDLKFFTITLMSIGLVIFLGSFLIKRRTIITKTNKEKSKDKKRA